MDERWWEIERIYLAARELDGSAREAFLTQACAGISLCEPKWNRCWRRRAGRKFFLAARTVKTAA
jgi:hypothetical protein